MPSISSSKVTSCGEDWAVSRYETTWALEYFAGSSSMSMMKMMTDDDDDGDDTKSNSKEKREVTSHVSCLPIGRMRARFAC